MYYILQMSCNCGNQPPCVPKVQQDYSRTTAAIKKGACLCSHIAAGLLQGYCSNFFKAWPSHFFPAILLLHSWFSAAISSRCGPVIFFLQFCCCIPGFTAAFTAAKMRSNFPAVFPSASQEISSIFWECCRNCVSLFWPRNMLGISKINQKVLFSYQHVGFSTTHPIICTSRYTYQLVVYDICII